MYLRDPRRFATSIRYEDLLHDPVAQASRVLKTVGLRWHEADPNNRPAPQSTSSGVNAEGVRAAMLTRRTPHGRFDHTDAATLFSEATTGDMVRVSEPEMSLLGYTRGGTDLAWLPPRRAPDGYRAGEEEDLSLSGRPP